MNGTVIALGMFDGMHRGHQALLERTTQLARHLGAQSMVFTFSNHPQSILGCPVPLLMTAEERMDAMLALGIQKVEMVPFDPTIAAMDPLDFLNQLRDRWGMRGMVAGFNYTFGKCGQGDVKLLQEYAQREKQTAEVLTPVLYKEHPVSSSRIRACLNNGELEQANAMLAAPYTLSGKVVPNRRIGASLGFPTANAQVPQEKLLPREGVYATLASFGEGFLPAVTNIGSNPTVGGEAITVETHLLNFQGDLYGKNLTVQFHKRLRGDIVFSSRDQLSRQIAADAAQAQSFFSEKSVYKRDAAMI